MDSTGAGIIADMLEIVANELPSGDAKRIARRIWNGPWRSVDACYQELGIADTLVELGLLRHVDGELEETE